ncbi:hypothetical protein NCAS_0D01620 [Naumovozyma castellii]|uniref:Dolichol phosphate-mannose biosynthesis regulatory protein n=1 Tax=Naumovozyma castellii TaxID=27288 RepID=G0VDV3_NAUCA|nr:hypothetical protein NCAS_0D01620 [Naumovozyma castellii CBS 4309]CCC69743.1 hypothetical protein NCAS_0D01620 [Naumovozyma castellii CBS 4309]
MNRFFLLLLVVLYYTIWLLLPMFGWEDKVPILLFPLPSVYAIYLPIFLLLLGTVLIGTFLGLLLLFA